MTVTDWLENTWADFCAWWETIDWGTAPDWLAAVGTAGALFLGLVILTRDKREAHQLEFRKLVSTPTVRTSLGSTEVVVEVFNANDHPIPLVVINRWGSQIWHRKLVTPGPGLIDIPAKTSASASVPVEGEYLDKNYYLQVTDSQGREWFRGLRTLRPIGARTIDRWNRRGRWRQRRLSRYKWLRNAVGRFAHDLKRLASHFRT